LVLLKTTLHLVLSYKELCPALGYIQSTKLLQYLETYAMRIARLPQHSSFLPKGFSQHYRYIILNRQIKFVAYQNDVRQYVPLITLWRVCATLCSRDCECFTWFYVMVKTSL